MSDVVVVNDNDEIIGAMSKDEAHKNGALHRIVVVYVENDKGEILVQNRVDGYLDHSAAGHVDPDMGIGLNSSADMESKSVRVEAPNNVRKALNV